MSDRAAFEGIQSATILNPGDRVLVVVGRDLTQRQSDNMSQRLADWFPGVDFAFLSGVEDVVVKPTEGSADA
jgi:hypothetical protein